MPHEDLGAVAECCAVRPLDKGQTLFCEGEPTGGFYVVQAGRVCISRLTADGKETILSVFAAPESFAEATLGTIEHYPANARALEPSQVILVRKAPFRDLIRRKPEFAFRMLASMAMHLKHLVQTLPDHRHIESRLASWILRFSPAAAAGCPAVFVLPMPKKILAGQLGTTSETLSRTFARFAKDRILCVTGPKIVVLDSTGLQNCANRG
ncbi:MAG: Crp/Fnr family transcriptional regulator [Opitutaceae bacterium]